MVRRFRLAGPAERIWRKLYCRPSSGSSYLCEVSLMCRISAMLDEDAILNASVIYSEEEVLAEFHECCELEAEAPCR